MKNKIGRKVSKSHAHVWTPAMGQASACKCGATRVKPYDMDKGTRPRQFLVNARPGSKSLPAPLAWGDLCACGQERRAHAGAHGWGRCSANECPSFQEVA